MHGALLDFYQQYYSSSIMKAVLYSNTSLDSLAELAANTWGKVPNRNRKTPVTDIPVVTEAQKGILIHYVPAQPRKVVRVEFRIDNNSAQFRSKTDELVAYLIGNRSAGILSDWLQSQGLAEGVQASSDPVVTGNGGVFTISVALTDKGLAQRDEVVAAIFHYLNLLREKDIDRRYFNEMSNVLALDFRYPSITRDMGFVEWLGDSMIHVPVEHVLDASSIADRFDSQVINARLAMMRPQNARILYISPEEPHDKMAYFFDAPYRVEKIPMATLADWQKRKQSISLNLPTLNPYIPTDFTLVKPDKTYTRPELLVDEPGLRVIYRPSHYFASEPRAMIQAMLRNPDAMSSARNQVLFALNDYLARSALDELGNQASVGGTDFSTYANSGLTVSASGYTQRLLQLFETLLDGYFNYIATEERLEQARSWYTRMLNYADKDKAYERAIMPVQMLSQVPYFQRDTRRALLKSVTLKEVLDYRAMLKSNARLKFMVIGNMTAGQAIDLARTVKAELNTQGHEWSRNKDVVIDHPQQAIFNKSGSTSDSALAAIFVPTGYDEFTGAAYSGLLTQIVQPWFYTQLRTEEQLGYAVFTFPIAVGRQWGIGFLLQSSDKQSAFLWQLYQTFFASAEKRLRDIDAATFAKIQQSVINQMQQTPQTLVEEFSELSKYFDRANMRFDSHERVINETKQVSLPRVVTYFHHAVIARQGIAILSEISGKPAGKLNDNVAPEGWKVWDSVRSLQQTLPLLRDKP